MPPLIERERTIIMAVDMYGVELSDELLEAWKDVASHCTDTNPFWSWYLVNSRFPVRQNQRTATIEAKIAGRTRNISVNSKYVICSERGILTIMYLLGVIDAHTSDELTVLYSDAFDIPELADALDVIESQGECLFDERKCDCIEVVLEEELSSAYRHLRPIMHKQWKLTNGVELPQYWADAIALAEVFDMKSKSIISIPDEYVRKIVLDYENLLTFFRAMYHECGVDMNELDEISEMLESLNATGLRTAVNVLDASSIPSPSPHGKHLQERLCAMVKIAEYVLSIASPDAIDEYLKMLDQGRLRSAFKAIANDTSVESCVAAYFAGVPVEDIVA